MNDLKFVLRQSLKNSGLMVVAAALLMAFPLRVCACTIFVLTDGQRTLFFNNEDYSNPVTRLWFAPAGKDHLGCAYVGFDNGWAQGGVNTAGLAFDWVAGFTEKWELRPDLTPVRGNPAQRMLESCTTVDEAVAFFQKHWEPDFSRSRLLVADRTGASAIIGARDNQLRVERSTQSRGFGYGEETLTKMLSESTEPTVANGLPILRACAQKGENPTQYSNIFDLRSGHIRMFPSTTDPRGVKLALAAELAKGGHYYDIPRLREQIDQPPVPLRMELKRFPLDKLTPVADQEPEITKRIQRILLDSAQGTMKPEDYTSEFWSEIAARRTDIQNELKQLGDFVSLTLVERENAGNRRVYCYRMEFEKIILLQRFVLDEQDRIQRSQTDAHELKPGLSLEKE